MEPDSSCAASLLVDELLGDSTSSLFSQLTSSISQEYLPDEWTEELVLERGDLRPSLQLNAALRSLVAQLTAPRRDEITMRAGQIIDASNKFVQRASIVRAIAAGAERELELLSVEGLREGGSHGISSEKNAMAQLKAMLPDFPYVGNYELLVDAEAQVLAEGPAWGDGAASGMARESVAKWWLERSPLASDGSTVAAAEGCKTPAATTPPPSKKRRAATQLLEGMTVAFCGSGPLPLTGLLLHMRAGARVVLIDRDNDAVAASKNLVRSLIRAGLVNADCVQLVKADAARVQFRRPTPGVAMCSPASKAGGETTTVMEVSCDAVVLASLLDADVKRQVAHGIGSSKDGPPLLLVRSAVGLVARLAYTTVAPGDLGQHMAYCGEWVPRLSLTSMEPHENAERPTMSEGGVPLRVLGTVDGGILNTFQLYLKA